MTGHAQQADAVLISDDSDFYGDEGTRRKYRKRAKRELDASRNQCWPKELRSSMTSSSTKQPDNDETLPASTTHPGRDLTEGAVETSMTTATRDESEESDQYKDLSRRQSGESVLHFLRRAPVADPATAMLGPWLWIYRPSTKGPRLRSTPQADVDTFAEHGAGLLEAFNVAKGTIQSQGVGKAKATITRALRPKREKLEDDLLSLAVKTKVVCGKWMLFPLQDDLPRVWRIVAESTANGILGHISKVATFDPLSSKSGTLICVYTEDFTDTVDVRRVLLALVDLGLCVRHGRPIYYKCDAYTYLNIGSDNSFEIPASIFSSRDLLSDVSPTGHLKGAMQRLKLAEEASK